MWREAGGCAPLHTPASWGLPARVMGEGRQTRAGEDGSVGKDWKDPDWECHTRLETDCTLQTLLCSRHPLWVRGPPSAMGAWPTLGFFCFSAPGAGHDRHARRSRSQANIARYPVQPTSPVISCFGTLKFYCIPPLQNSCVDRECLGQQNGIVINT